MESTKNSEKEKKKKERALNNEKFEEDAIAGC
jgi:hypothetical protein